MVSQALYAASPPNTPSALEHVAFLPTVPADGRGKNIFDRPILSSSGGGGSSSSSGSSSHRPLLLAAAPCMQGAQTLLYARDFLRQRWQLLHQPSVAQPSVAQPSVAQQHVATPSGETHVLFEAWPKSASPLNNSNKAEEQRSTTIHEFKQQPGR